MNGDFLSLLPKSTFAAGAAAAGGRGGPPHLDATTVFAFHCAAGVIVAGDHRATAGGVVFSDRTEKIVELDRHSLLAIAGSPAVALEMARTLQTTFEFYRRSQFQPMSLPAKMRALARLLHENVPAALQGFGLVSPIFAGLDAAAGRPGIYFYDPLGAQFEAASYAGSGSGSGSIKSVLHFLEQWGRPPPAAMTLAQGVCLANRLLLTAAEFDTATGGVDPGAGEFATVKLLDASGVRAIGREEQARFWQEADMTEEPYRWLEAVANRREYIRDQLRGGSPVFALSRPEGLLLCGVGTGQSKIFEIYDRHGLAALGHPVDIEKVRQSLIEAAHLEGFTRAPEDVTVRRLLNFSLGPALKAAFEQIYGAPLIVEGIFAEVGPSPEQDILARFSHDGTWRFEAGGAAVAHPAAERESAAAAWLKSRLGPGSSLAEAVRAALAAWKSLHGEADNFPDRIPAAAPDLGGKVVEAALLERRGGGRARYRPLAPADWGHA